MGEANTGAEWMEQARRLLEAVSGALAGAGDGAPPGEGCRWCLHCQITAVLRDDRPEVSAALADVLTTTSTALRSFTAAEAAPRPAGEERPEPPDVQHIEIA